MSNLMPKPHRPSAIHLIVPIILLLSCLGLSLGLTFAPCYSSMCVERYFPYQTRVHIALFYSLVAGLGIFLSLRAFWRPFRNLSEYHVFQESIPFTDERLSIGAAFLFLWIAAFVFSSIAYWLPAENAFWYARGSLADWTPYIFRVVWTGVTGHWCDILIGLVVLPVGRNSFLAQNLQLHTSTLLLAHKLLAYSLLVGGLIHGLLYYSFLGAWVNEVSSNEGVYDQFNPDNPTLTAQEAKARGIYSWFCLPTGAITGIILVPVVAITALPILRLINYNVFYFTHVAIAILIMILVCLHASTNFYFILPGLLLWINDWVWRVQHALGTEVMVDVENAGNGWYRIRLPPDVPAFSKDVQPVAHDKVESALQSISPLQTYYVNVGQISRIEAHPFTTALTESSDSGPVLLFQRGPAKKKAKARDKEWTWKLASIADDAFSEKAVSLQARIEGPYTPHADRLYEADHILAIVGGTGITGAISIANWWCSYYADEPRAKKSLRLVWTIRQQEFSQVQEVQELQSRFSGMSNTSFMIRVSSQQGRLSIEDEFASFFNGDQALDGKVWVYTSGPDGLLAGVETACVKQRRVIRKLGNQSRVKALDCYSARHST